MTTDKFICDVMNYHSTWVDTLNNFLIGLTIIGLVYVWRTTRKK